MKRLLSILLCICLLMANITTTMAEQITYEGSAYGFGGDVTVVLTWNGEAWDVSVAGDQETPSYGGKALSTLAEQLQAAQSPEIDGVSGATVTSNAAIRAASIAFDAANGAERTAVVMTDGVYTGESFGYKTSAAVENGEVVLKGGIIRAEVTIQDGVMTNIGISESSYNSKTGEVTWTSDPTQFDTPGLGPVAAAEMPGRILEAQSVGVDVVSGATITSNGIKIAVTNALMSANADDSFFAAKESVCEARTEVLETEVVVVGSGAAGSAAAIEAVRSGAKVVWLEKLDVTGGAAQTSGGAVQASSNLNREGYLTDENGTMILSLKTLPNDLSEVSHANFWHENFKGVQSSSLVYDWVSYPLNRYQAQQGNALIHWLQDELEIQMYAPTAGGGSGAMYRSYRPSGNTYTDGTQIKGEAGRQITDKIRDSFENEYGDLGVLYTGTEATKLIMDENGSCIGVVAYNESTNTTYEIYASGGVILCTGGYENNEEMMAEYAPLGVHTVTLGASAGDDGDGHRMAMEVGADYYYSGYFPDAGDLFANAPDGNQANIFNGTLLKASAPIVTDKGYRFGGLTTSHLKMLAASEDGLISHEIDGGVFKIFGSNMPGVTDDQYAYLRFGTTFGGVYTADTLEELCSLMGIDYQTLQATIDNWNAIVDGTVEDEFGVTQAAAAKVGKVNEGPYYGFKYGHANNGTFGGVKINLDGQVLSKITDHAADELVESGAPIPGLYAAGEIANCEFYGQKYISGGTSIAFSMLMGKTAAAHAANRAHQASNGGTILRDDARTGGESLQFKSGNHYAIFSGALAGEQLGVEITAPEEIAEVTSVTCEVSEVKGVSFTDLVAFAELLYGNGNTQEDDWQPCDVKLNGKSFNLTLTAGQKNIQYRVKVTWNDEVEEVFIVEYVNPEGTIVGVAHAMQEDALAPVGGVDVTVTMQSVSGTTGVREASVSGTVSADAEGLYRTGVEILLPEVYVPSAEMSISVYDAEGRMVDQLLGWNSSSAMLACRQESVKPNSMTGKNTGTSTLYYLVFTPEVLNETTYTIVASWSDYQPLDDTYTVHFVDIVLAE